MDPYTTVTELARLVRDKQVSPVEVVDTYLDRIERLNPAVNAIVWLDAGAARAAAEEAGAAVVRGDELGPLHGVPIPIKDLHSVAGQPNTMSSLGVSDAPRPETDPDVQTLLDAGAIPLGRTNSPEFGPLTVAENARHGKTRNPWNLAFTSGGSSGGASAAVAAGLAPAAHASDGGGSIRVPASVTGLIGLKPSRGRVPTLVRGWEHSTTEGAITRTVADTALLLDVMAGQDLLGWYSAPAPARAYTAEVGADPGTLRIGLMLEAPSGLPVDADCVAAAHRLAGALTAAGHEVFPVAPKLYSQQSIVGFTQVVISASVYAVEVDDESLLDPYIRYRREYATQVHAGEYARVAALLQYESRQVVAQWGRDFDLLLTPTTACVTPPVGLVYDEANTDPAGPRTTEVRMVSFTAFVNIAGLPAISLPVHTAANGLPVGAQLVGGPFDEATLIRVASQVEQQFAWAELRPDLDAGVAAAAGAGIRA
jgi:amidase